MRFTLENKNGKPAVKSAGENPFVAEDLAILHKAVKTQANLSTEEAHWLGLCCVMFAAISLLRWKNQLSQTNILKSLDAFYFSFPDPQTAQAFQDGENAGIELAREAVQNGNEANITELFAMKLGY